VAEYCSKLNKLKIIQKMAASACINDVSNTHLKDNNDRCSRFDDHFSEVGRSLDGLMGERGDRVTSSPTKLV
jgi:hypothetical protein